MIAFQFLLWCLTVKPLGSFNIDTGQRWVSPPMSSHFGHQVLQHSDGQQNWKIQFANYHGSALSNMCESSKSDCAKITPVSFGERILATSLGPGDSGRLYKCSWQDEIYCKEASFGENIQNLKKLQPGIALAQNPEKILACVQQKRRQLRKATEELNGLCILLSGDFREKAFINLTDIIETKLNQSSLQRNKRSYNSDRTHHADTKASSSAGHTGGFAGVANSNCQAPQTHMCREKDHADGGLELGHNIFNTNNNNNYMEEEDESDLRTEIAIILDGSGSIEPEDFERAKDFIYNIMKTFYAKCFECIFALVQYGSIIRTEFDLQDGRDSNTALAKVQAVTQVRNVTRTASAIQHVLDSIFHESRGSQKNAAKIIVVLTDGEIFLDPLNLTTVINSKRMAGIDRYAIGVGNAFNKAKALNELRLIASDPDETHLFQVTNYSALHALLSTLQQKLIGIEGTAGDILEFELAQSGFSAHFLDEHYILFGTVGAFDWSGGILLYEIASKTAVFLNESKEATGGINSYLGYSVAAVSARQGALTIAGAPRHSMTGRVMVFEGELLKQTLHGEQIGSYFGAELCPLDTDQDGLTDYLLIGAPFFHVLGEEGKVYIYRFDNETNSFAMEGHLKGQPAVAFARFGFAMASIGDVDLDGYGDVAIGAPLENHEADPSCLGSIYIYNGKKDGIQRSFSQRITAAQISPGIVHFGRSVAGGLDFTEDGLPDITVGSLGRVTLLRSRPVLRLDPTMQFTPERISNFHNSSCIVARLCFHRTFPLETDRPGIQNLIIRFTMDLDVEMEKKRVQFEDHATALSSEISLTEHPCTELELYVLPCNDNCFSGVAVRLSYWLNSASEHLNDPMPTLDIYRESEVYFQLPYKDDCENKTWCAPHLTLTVHAEKELVVGATKELTMSLHLANAGDNSYMTSLLLEYPANLIFKKVQALSSLVDCDASRPAGPQFSFLNCKIGHPVFRTTANFSVTWQLDERKFPNDSPSITVNLSNTNPNSMALIEEHFLNVKYAFTSFISRPDRFLYVNVGERSSQITCFEFNINGKNPYGAQLELQVWVPALIADHQVISVKNATGSQAFTKKWVGFMLTTNMIFPGQPCYKAPTADLQKIIIIGPSNPQDLKHSYQGTLTWRLMARQNENTTICRTASDFIRKDFGHIDLENTETIQYQLVSCVIMSEKENVIVTAELALANSPQVFQDRTGLLVTGEIIFNRDLYVGLSESHHKTQITVVLLKERDFDYFPFLIGSSLVGILLLALIVAVLYKGGFFKRNYKNMLDEQQHNSLVGQDSNYG